MSPLQTNPLIARRLQSAADPRGLFRVLALDHRRALWKLLGDAEQGVAAAAQFKLDVTRGLGPLSSAVLLDAEVTAPLAVETGPLPPGVALLVSFSLASSNHGSQVPEELPILLRRAAELGAVGVKLYLPVRMENQQTDPERSEYVRDFAGCCHELQLPLYLEIVCDTADSPDTAADVRQSRILHAVDSCAGSGPELLKIPFPSVPRGPAWTARARSACAELNAACTVPWVLLSSGAPIDEFAEQLEVACEAGCSGFIAGRAVWHELAVAPADERQALLQTLLIPRMRRLNTIVERHGHDWRQRTSTGRLTTSTAPQPAMATESDGRAGVRS